jgi:transposase InsO family protein
LKASGLSQAKVIHRPRLLSDNGSSYIAADLAKWLEGQNIAHIRGAPYHPMAQGKIERWRQTLKNRILLENYELRRVSPKTSLIEGDILIKLDKAYKDESETRLTTSKLCSADTKCRCRLVAHHVNYGAAALQPLSERRGH